MAVIDAIFSAIDSIISRQFERHGITVARGYLNRVIRLNFPDLAGRERDDDPESPSVIWVTIRNPRLMSGEELTGDHAGDEDRAKAAYASFARMIIGAFVYDPTDDSEEPRVLTSPPDPAVVGGYPIEILNALAEEVKKANPHSSQDPSTSKTSTS